VLYNPEGKINNNPLYTFTYDPAVGLPGLPQVPGYPGYPGAPTVPETNYPGQEYGGDDDVIPEYDERGYPPVEPYEANSPYLGAKLSEGQ
jgi:hypothetical protein